MPKDFCHFYVLVGLCFGTIFCSTNRYIFISRQLLTVVIDWHVVAIWLHYILIILWENKMMLLILKVIPLQFL